MFITGKLNEYVQQKLKESAKVKEQYEKLLADNPYSEQLKTYSTNADGYKAKADEYQAQLDNRKFSYDPASDPEYQYTLERYKTMGSQAAKETAASLASNTGGIANSYAASAAQAAYQDYLQEAAGLAKQYRDSARSQFDAETAALESRLAKYENMYDTAEANRLSADANSKAYLNSLKSLYEFDEDGNVIGRVQDTAGTDDLTQEIIDNYVDLYIKYDSEKANNYAGLYDLSQEDYEYLFKYAESAKEIHNEETQKALDLKNNKYTKAFLNGTENKNDGTGYISGSKGGGINWGGDKSVNWDEKVEITFADGSTEEMTYKEFWKKIRKELFASGKNQAEVDQWYKGEDTNVEEKFRNFMKTF